MNQYGLSYDLLQSCYKLKCDSRINYHVIHLIIKMGCAYEKLSKKYDILQPKKLIMNYIGVSYKLLGL